MCAYVCGWVLGAYRFLHYVTWSFLPRHDNVNAWLCHSLQPFKISWSDCLTPVMWESRGCLETACCYLRKRKHEKEDMVGPSVTLPVRWRYSVSSPDISFLLGAQPTRTEHRMSNSSLSASHNLMKGSLELHHQDSGQSSCLHFSSWLSRHFWMVGVISGLMRKTHRTLFRFMTWEMSMAHEQVWNHKKTEPWQSLTS